MTIACLSWIYQLFSHTCHTTGRDRPLVTSRAVQICSRTWKLQSKLWALKWNTFTQFDIIVDISADSTSYILIDVITTYFISWAASVGILKLNNLWYLLMTGHDKKGILSVVGDGRCQQDGIEKKTKTRFRSAIQDTVSSSACLGWEAKAYWPKIPIHQPAGGVLLLTLTFP